MTNPILHHSLSSGQGTIIVADGQAGEKKEDQSPTGGESTDAQSVRDDESQLSNAFGAKHTFDWSEVAYLFESGEIPEEIASITDPVEYNYLMVRLRKEFNEKHKSNYLKYMSLNLPYHSRRDEVGGAITDSDWSNFVLRLEGVIAKVGKKRARIIRRRKKKGKKKMPRKTLFKPEKKIDVGKEPLWREIFIDKATAKEDSDSESDGEDLFQMFRDACAKKGIKISKESLQGASAKAVNSGKVELFNREKDPLAKLPEIKNPSMHPKEKP